MENFKNPGLQFLTSKFDSEKIDLTGSNNVVM